MSSLTPDELAWAQVLAEDLEAAFEEETPEPPPQPTAPAPVTVAPAPFVAAPAPAPFAVAPAPLAPPLPVGSGNNFSAVEASLRQEIAGLHAAISTRDGTISELSRRLEDEAAKISQL